MRRLNGALYTILSLLVATRFLLDVSGYSRAEGAAPVPAPPASRPAEPSAADDDADDLSPPDDPPNLRPIQGANLGG
jgi:hypothetical protein